jgi:hypothetical protein
MIVEIIIATTLGLFIGSFLYDECADESCHCFNEWVLPTNSSAAVLTFAFLS